MAQQLTDNLRDPAQDRWSVSRKIFSLWLICYTFFYIFPFPMSGLPLIRHVFHWYELAYNALSLFVGRHILQLSDLKKIENTGSFDTELDYVRALCSLCLSLLATAVIFRATRKRPNYSKWFEWAIVYARYFVALEMLEYGFFKIFLRQFGFPNYPELEQLIGDNSPMDMVWDMMGFSKQYAFVGGFFEVLGGFFLFFRRTAVIGAIISMAVMLEITLLNYFYDIPLKLLCTHLVLFCIFIMGPEMKKLYGFFIQQKPAQLYVPALKLPYPWMYKARGAGKIIFISALVLVHSYHGLHSLYSTGIMAPEPLLAATYKVDTFVLNQDTLAPLTTDSIRWNRMIIDRAYVSITTMSKEPEVFEPEIDSRKSIILRSPGDSIAKNIFTYREDPDHFHLQGIYRGDSIAVTFIKKTMMDYILLKRGYHWTTDYPYNF